MKWESWEKERGKTKAEAQQEFLDYAIPILEYRGFAYLVEDPEKEAKEAAYEECVERALNGGKTIEEINMETYQHEQE